MGLIDADKTIGHIKTRLLETALNNCSLVCDVSYIYQDCADNRIETWVDEMPTVDAVEVVRCKDCRWFENDGYHTNCKIIRFCVEAEDYCSRGERREDDNK